MSGRVKAVLAFCLALAVAQILGLHSHLSIDDDSPMGLATAESEASHMTAHLEHGDIDVDVPSVSVTKSSPPSPTWLLIGFICGLVVLLPSKAAPILPPPLRPPKLRRRRFLLPPSQAPPHTR